MSSDLEKKDTPTLYLMDGSGYEWRDGGWVQFQPATEPPIQGMFTVSDFRVGPPFPASAPVPAISEPNAHSECSHQKEIRPEDVEAAYREGWNQYASYFEPEDVSDDKDWENSEAKKKLEGKE